jgi:hypothetical protein
MLGLHLAKRNWVHLYVYTVHKEWFFSFLNATFLTFLFNILHQKIVVEREPAHSNSRTMFLTESEVNDLLQNPLFTFPIFFYQIKQEYMLHILGQ